MKMLSVIAGLLAESLALTLAGLFVLGARFGEAVSKGTKKERKMLQGVTKNVIKESPTEQLTQMYYGLVKAISMRSAQGMGTDEALSETVAEVVAEMNVRTSGGDQDLQLPPAA